MKKMYKQPIVETNEMMPQSIVCTSSAFGGGTQGGGEGGNNITEGD